MNRVKHIALTIVLLCSITVGWAQESREIVINLDESKVEPYTLPHPLIMENGQSVKSVEDWEGGFPKRECAWLVKR